MSYKQFYKFGGNCSALNNFSNVKRFKVISISLTNRQIIRLT